MNFLRENNSKRSTNLPVRGKILAAPVYFPSISSIKTNFNPLNYFKVLKALNQTHFLVSAYDVANSKKKDEFITELKSNFQNNGPYILMDSGNYESWWLRDKQWQIQNFNDIVKEQVADLSFCYDNQFPPDDIAKNVSGVNQSVLNSQGVVNTTSIIPIIHCKKEVIVPTVLELIKTSNSWMVSIPERILGNGLLERIDTITKLRKELNKLDNYTFIHILGTGNPFSLLLLSFAGADSFDGLEWCQTVVNTRNATLYHFQQRELILDDCEFCSDKELDYYSATLGHNLKFYASWMKQIQEAISNKTEKELLEKYFERAFISELEKIWN